MSFNISLDDGEHGAEISGSIHIGSFVETFVSTTGIFSRTDYRNLWRDAIIEALKRRRPVALFTDLNLNDNYGWGVLWMYNLIPSEEAYPVDEKLAQSGFFITQRFMYIATKPEVFLEPVYLEFEDETKEEISLHYFDVSAPFRFFGYIEQSIAGLSSWFVKNECLERFLSMENELQNL